MRTRARGFSLIELLVTIFVIATLLGVLLPALPRVRDSARRAACAAHLSDIAKAVLMRRNDHEGKFPKAKYMPDPWLSGDDDPSFNDAMRDYLAVDSGVYVCPGDRVVHSFAYTDATGARRATNSSYTFNTALSGVVFEESFYARFLQRSETQTPVLHDFDGGTFETQAGQQVQVDFFHARRNVLFADGHVGPAKAPRR